MLQKKYHITLSFLLLGFLAVAQPRSFSQKPEVFIEEFNAYINSDNTKEGQAIMKSFTTKWDSAKFVEPEQRNIINVANQMLQNDLRIPSFVLFTETMLYAKDSIDESKYISWAKSLSPAIQSGNKTFLTLMQASRNLFKDNLLYVSETKNWYASTDNYRLLFDNNRVQIAFKDIDLTCQAQVDQITI